MRLLSGSNSTGNLVSRSALAVVGHVSFAAALLALADIASAQGPSMSLSTQPQPQPRVATQPEPSTTNTISRGVKDVFEKSAKAVVKVHGTDELGEFAGTGFFIDTVGTLYTAYSVA